MNRIFLSTTLTLAAVTPFTVHGQDSAETLNRFSFGARLGFNFKADFKNGSGFFSPVNPGAAIGGANHTYDDGYVLLDSSDNAGGLTWNWGYENSSQVVGDTMEFHAIQSASSASTTGDPQYGFELIYQRVISDLPVTSGRWGIEAGFGFTQIDLRSHRRENVSVITDAYQLNGLLPPGAGYNGTFGGPGMLLGDTPTRTFESGALNSSQELCGQMFTIRIGPFAEWNFTPQLSLAASIGVTLAPTTVDYNFSETVVLTGGTFVASGHSSQTGLLYGPYVSGMLRYDFSKRWGVYVGAQFQSLTDLKQTAGGRTAKLDPGATVYATMGMSFNF